MAQINVNIRMDENLKKDFDSFCSAVGISMTTAFCMFAKATLRENKIPFEICAGDPIYRKENIERLTKAVAELDVGKGTEHDLIEDSDQ